MSRDAGAPPSSPISHTHRNAPGSQKRPGAFLYEKRVACAGCLRPPAAAAGGVRGKGEGARKLLPPSQREVAPKGSVGVSKGGLDNFFECICEGTSSQTQFFYAFRPTFATPPVAFGASPLGEGAWRTFTPPRRTHLAAASPAGSRARQSGGRTPPAGPRRRGQKQRSGAGGRAGAGGWGAFSERKF